MLKKLALALGLSCFALTAPACDGGGYKITNAQLKAGGMFVAYNLGCEKGCDAITPGDLILEIDGRPLETGADFDAANITDGQPHKLKVHKKSGDPEELEVEIVAKPNDTLEPHKGLPPFLVTSADKMTETPDWARLRLFGNASPQILLVNSDGGLINGRDFYGKKRLIVFFDWQTRSGQANAGTFLKTLQLAQADLNGAGVEIMFAQVQFPGRDRPPMNDTDLRKFHADNQLKPNEGGPKPFLPLYRFPNATENQPARNQGMSGATTYLQYMGSDPAIVILDERGVVRWHSEGVIPDPTSKNPSDANYTIIEAIKFAQSKL